MLNIILCGMPKSGKTTIGKILAEVLQRPFVDTDYLIEKAYREEKGIALPCRQIALKEGENYFRNIERLQIDNLRKYENHIISLGGGTLTYQKNIDILTKIGLIYYPQTSFKKIWPRIKATGIPSYLKQDNAEEEFFEIYKIRTQTFEKNAHVTINTSQLSKNTIVQNIKKHFQEYYGQ